MLPMLTIKLFLELLSLAVFYKLALMRLEAACCVARFEPRNASRTFSQAARAFLSLLSPQTILSAWKKLVSKHWAHKHKPGRKPLAKSIKALILKMKKENPLWGARRIRDELKKISI